VFPFIAAIPVVSSRRVGAFGTDGGELVIGPKGFLVPVGWDFTGCRGCEVAAEDVSGVDEGRAGVLFDEAPIEGIGAFKGIVEVGGCEKAESPGRDVGVP